MLAIYKKELKIYFSGVFAPIIIALLLLFAGLFTVLFHFVTGYIEFAYTLASMEWVLIVLIPFLSMRAIAEERHQCTDLLLFSLPLSTFDIVMGKFLAVITVFFIPTAIMVFYPPILSMFGTVSLASAYGALTAYFLMGVSLISLSLFMSSLVENQIVAAVLSIGSLVVLYFIGSFASLLPPWPVLSLILCLLASLGVGALLWKISKNAAVGLLTALPFVAVTVLTYIVRSDLFKTLVKDFLVSLDPFTRFKGFTYGHIDIPSLIFYLTFSGFFFYLTLRSVEKRRV